MKKAKTGETANDHKFSNVDDRTFTHGSLEASTHLADEPGRRETQKTHHEKGRDWIDSKHELDDASPEHIDLGAAHNLEDYDDDAEEVGYQYFRMSVTDAIGSGCHAQGSKMSCQDERRQAQGDESTARRAQVASKGQTKVGDFNTGVNRGANLLRSAMYALHSGVGTDDVSGEPLKGEMLMAARKLELDLFEKMGV